MKGKCVDEKEQSEELSKVSSDCITFSHQPALQVNNFVLLFTSNIRTLNIELDARGVLKFFTDSYTIGFT